MTIGVYSCTKPRPPASRPRFIRQAGDFGEDWETARSLKVARCVNAIVGPVACETKPRASDRSKSKPEREREERAGRPGAGVGYIRLGQHPYIGRVHALLLA